MSRLRDRLPQPSTLHPFETLERREVPATFEVATFAGLQEAIGASNANGEDDVIRLAADVVISAELDPFAADGGHAVSIEGDGFLVQQSLAGTRVIRNAGADLSLSHVLIAGGNGVADGGGILNESGSLSLSRVSVAGNAADRGAGLFNAAGATATVTEGTFTGNDAVVRGGGVYNAGTLTIASSTLTNHKAPEGGGVFNEGSLTVGTSVVADQAEGEDVAGSYAEDGVNFIGAGAGLSRPAAGPNGSIAVAPTLASPELVRVGLAAGAGQDQFGTPRPAENASLGSVQLDLTPPTVELFVAPDVGQEQVEAPRQWLVLRVTDDQAADLFTLDDQDLRVQRPDGSTDSVVFDEQMTGHSIQPDTYFYVYRPPGGAWDAADNGTYRVVLQPDQITSLSGVPAAFGTLGTFEVNVEDTGGSPAPAPLAVSQDDGLLVIGGTEGRDDLTITQTDAGMLRVFDAGTLRGEYAGIDRIEVRTGGSDDRVAFGSAIAADIVVDGGAGFDTLDFSAVADAVTVRLGDGAGAAGTFADVENLVLTEQDDTLVATDPGLEAGDIDGGGGTDLLDLSPATVATSYAAAGTLNGSVALRRFEVLAPAVTPVTTVTTADGSVRELRGVRLQQLADLESDAMA